MNTTLLQQMLIMPATDQSIVVLDAKGVIRAHNTKNLDIPLSEGTNFTDFLLKNGVELDILQDSIDNDNLTSRTSEVLIKQPNGIKQWILINLYPYVNDDGEKNYFLQLINIDHYKNSQLQLDRHRANYHNELMIRSQSMAATDKRMTGQPDFMTNFFRGLRHDIKSPLAQLSGLMEYAKTVEKESKKKQIETHINACLVKLNNTAKSLSDFVDVVFLATEAQEVINLEQLTENTFEVLQADLKDIDNLELKTDFSNAPTVSYNRKMLKSIFFNLIENAVKFRKNDQSLSINLTSALTPEGLQIQIADNGIGIDLDKYGEKLFKPFTRLTADRPGAGNGLSLIKNMLDKTGDHISVTSQPGTGTTFTILFSNQHQEKMIK